jgi:hypothetical protein
VGIPYHAPGPEESRGAHGSRDRGRFEYEMARTTATAWEPSIRFGARSRKIPGLFRCIWRNRKRESTTFKGIPGRLLKSF